jgi:NAD(P)-dependent dehydrogenase (short-subunit alcohol dehydrogenase family)
MPYVAAKFALFGYFKALSKKLCRENIVVSAIAPGPIDYPDRYLSRLRDEGGAEWEQFTRDHLPSRKLVMVEDIVSAAEYLISKEAGHCFGSIIEIRG